MKLLLGIDLGTSYFKVGLFTSEGGLRGLGRVAVNAERAAPGRVELSTAIFWERLRIALGIALAEAGARVEEIVGVAYSSQANTCLLIDEVGRELTPLILWNDQRASPLRQELIEFGAVPEFGKITGLGSVSPGAMPAKCGWFAGNVPELWRRTAKVLTISDYLTFKLTGRTVGDVSTAALTGLCNLSARDWWDVALAKHGIQREQLAALQLPGTLVGETVSEATERLGLRPGVPFVAGALDHHAAALGSGVGLLADASLSGGTVLAALTLVDQITLAQGCIHGPHVDGVAYYRLVFDPNGAGSVESYRRQYAPGETIDDLLAAAESSNLAGDGGTEHGKAVLALLHSLAAAQKNLLMRLAGSAAIRTVSATGGLARSTFWLQLTADTLRLPVVSVASSECACLGAAVLAAPAAGLYRGISDAMRVMVKPAQIILPCD